MIIAGGVYVENCVAPETSQLLGSGGRAALALMTRRRGLHLHTFHPSNLWTDLEANFVANGIECTAHSSAERVSFTYLFPLGRPVRTPDRMPIALSAKVEGELILGFGCIEGRFILDAKTAVYDPQGDVDLGFRDMGSRAKNLALVLNADEARTMTGQSGIRDAAQALLKSEDAQVVVVKGGPMGAFVLTLTGSASVPAYHSTSLYKIGSGDIFSATFAHRFMEGDDAATAADHASRQTAAYVEAPVLPLLDPPVGQQPRLGLPNSHCLVVCNQESISSKWATAIIVEAIEHLGIYVLDVIDHEAWRTDRLPPLAGSSQRRDLIIANDETLAHEFAQIAAQRGASPVIFVEALPSRQPPAYHSDLSQALYELCWTAS